MSIGDNMKMEIKVLKDFEFKGVKYIASEEIKEVPVTLYSGLHKEFKKGNLEFVTLNGKSFDADCGCGK